MDALNSVNTLNTLNTVNTAKYFEHSECYDFGTWWCYECPL